MSEPSYKTAEDFRRALEQRLTTQAKAGGRGLVRERQVFIFERFLARAVATDMDVVIKGGMALELQTVQARSTRDIDLRAMGAPELFHAALLELGACELADYLSFRVDPHARPVLDAIGMKYPGKRYRVQALLAGKVYGDPFGVDVAFGEPILGAPGRVRGRADLSFIGIEPPELTVYPRATHIAEKLHAYTVPRPTPNSRVRDLPDIAILASIAPIGGDELRCALEQTFEYRGTHPVPDSFPSPPERWRMPYAELAEANRLPWEHLDAVHEHARTFLDPVLRGESGSWRPETWDWTAGSSQV